MGPLMSTNSVWIVIAAVVAVLVVAAVIAAANKAIRRRRQRQAEEIRDQAKVATAGVEARAAVAARLLERAATHHGEGATSRRQLQGQWERVGRIDPQTAKHEARGEQPYESANDGGAARHRRASSG